MRNSLRSHKAHRHRRKAIFYFMKKVKREMKSKKRKVKTKTEIRFYALYARFYQPSALNSAYRIMASSVQRLDALWKE
jgi:hypothetical protein